MIENLNSISIFSPTIPEILLNLLVSIICGFSISAIYKHTYKGPGYSPGFVHSIALLSIITTLVLMIIGNNLARAFGLVGALSIIRFRTAIKDTIDIVYIFLALAIGMASGVGFHKLAFIGTIIVGGILFLISSIKTTFNINNFFVLQFNLTSDGKKDNSFQNILRKFCSGYNLISVHSDEINNTFEYTYNIRMRKKQNVDEFLDQLNKINGINGINLFFDKQPF